MLFVLSALLAVGCGGAAGEDNEVFVATVEGEINNRAANYVERVISEAEEADASAVAIELDTPGGALTATESIIETISGASETPVVVYVPRGGAAISAGTFIVMASDVAAMAPGTRLGAASPVTAFGSDIPGTMGEKVTNDSVALITGLAETHGRNEEWAESAVREAASENAEDALDMEIVEYIEPDLESALAAADGESLESKGITLDVADAALVQQNETFRERFGIPLWTVVLPSVLGVLAVVGIAIAAVRTRRWKIATGREGMVGEVGEVRRTVSGSKKGSVFVHGELWTAVAEDKESPPMEPGDEVEIAAFRRSYIVVRRHEG
ncbi:MAG: ATP-dependent Clp protease proteolytic subunit [Rubrobacter sp.]|nr:ATP-dependent Clp protease proteolytic subunit [Rubrobacter sp.]